MIIHIYIKTPTGPKINKEQPRSSGDRPTSTLQPAETQTVGGRLRLRVAAARRAPSEALGARPKSRPAAAAPAPPGIPTAPKPVEGAQTPVKTGPAIIYKAAPRCKPAAKATVRTSPDSGSEGGSNRKGAQQVRNDAQHLQVSYF